MTHEGAPLILYVEDEAIVALAVVMALEDAGYRVQHASAGREAVDVIEHTGAAYAALLTDVRLPQVDGWTIARRARELNPELPIGYISGDSASDWASRGVPGSIMKQKPCSTDEVVAAGEGLLAYRVQAEASAPRE